MKTRPTPDKICHRGIRRKTLKAHKDQEDVLRTLETLKHAFGGTNDKKKSASYHSARQCHIKPTPSCPQRSKPKRQLESVTKLLSCLLGRIFTEYSYKTRRQFKLVTNRLPYGIFVGIFSEDQKAVRVGYEPTPLWNISRNISRRPEGSSGQLRTGTPMEYSQEYFRKIIRQFVV